MSLMTKT